MQIADLFHLYSSAVEQPQFGTSQETANGTAVSAFDCVLPSWSTSTTGTGGTLPLHKNTKY